MKKSFLLLALAGFLSTPYGMALDAPVAGVGTLTQVDLAYFFDSITEINGKIVFVVSRDASGMKWELETHKGVASGVSHAKDAFALPEDWGCLVLERRNIKIVCFSAPGSFHAVRLYFRSERGRLDDERECVLEIGLDHRVLSAPFPKVAL